MDTQQEQISLLYRLSKIMHTMTDVTSALNSCLKLMADTLQMMRGMITLISPETGEIHIHTSYGLSQEEQERGHYLKGEGITGRVIETGKPMYVTNVSQNPLFLNKTRSRDLRKENISFLCVPIMLNQDIVGALSVDKLLSDPTSLEADLRLLEIIASILGHAALECQRRMDEQRAPSRRPHEFIGSSEEMEHVYQLIEQVAASEATVLLQGESGTGKELAARAIHAQSPRKKAPFISLNCAALPENLIESELFGHEKGAFTGAQYTRKGRFELADTGTLFLDEIGELPLCTQAKLLRVLQNLSFERVGGMATHTVDVRLICATNRNLAQMVEEGSFRRDLYFRINVFPILLPPLRDRKNDILALCTHFLKKLSPPGKPVIRLSFAAMDLLEHYSFPGNVRELQNILERAVLLLGRSTLILPEHLPGIRPDGTGGRTSDTADLQEEDRTAGSQLMTQISTLEKESLITQLTKHHGIMRLAAQELGISERVFGLRMKKYNLSYKTFRQKTAAS